MLISKGYFSRSLWTNLLIMWKTHVERIFDMCLCFILC